MLNGVGQLFLGKMGVVESKEGVGDCLVVVSRLKQVNRLKRRRL